VTAQGFPGSGAAGQAPLGQIDLGIVQQRQVSAGNQAEAQAQNEFVQQEVHEGVGRQQRKEPHRIERRSDQDCPAPSPQIGEVARRHFAQRDRQGEQCLGLQYLAHAQSEALQ